MPTDWGRLRVVDLKAELKQRGLARTGIKEDLVKRLIAADAEAEAAANAGQQDDMPTQPRPLFIYGTLCALPLLALVLTGDASNPEPIVHLLCKARVDGYRRCSLHNLDHPAAIPDHSSVDGYIIYPQTAAQRRKLDDFEGDPCTVTPITARTFDQNGEPSGETVEADMHVWNGSMAALSEEPWDLGMFITERLADWIELFTEVELFGE